MFIHKYKIKFLYSKKVLLDYTVMLINGLSLSTLFSWYNSRVE